MDVEKEKGDIMRIGLVDVDGHHFPNLALMKIAAYHKSVKDSVEWADPLFGRCDRVYKSKVFTFSPDDDTPYACEVVKGGTGYGMYSELPEEVDGMCPDYSIYPQFKAAYGFLTRGCPNRCPWCIVPKKEGTIRAYSDIEDWLCGRKEAVIMDNNIIAHQHGLEQLEKIARMGIRVDINQGVEAGRITPEIAGLLSRVRFSKYVRIACDTRAALPAVETAVERMKSAGIRPEKVFCYVLVKDVDDALYRIERLRSLGVQPFAQPYRDFRRMSEPTSEQRRLARWCNMKAIFKTVRYEDYKG